MARDIYDGMANTSGNRPIDRTDQEQAINQESPQNIEAHVLQPLNSPEQLGTLNPVAIIEIASRQSLLETNNSVSSLENNDERAQSEVMEIPEDSEAAASN